jgi:tetrahydromethanopterin S-methyltransferase subunit F
MAIILLDQKADSGTNVTTITMLIGFLAPTIAALLGLAKARENEVKMTNIESKVDAGKATIEKIHEKVEEGFNGVQQQKRDEGLREGLKMQRELYEKDKPQ